jgi:hypothetical protein
MLIDGVGWHNTALISAAMAAKRHLLLTPDHFAGGLQVAFVTVRLPA